VLTRSFPMPSDLERQIAQPAVSEHERHSDDCPHVASWVEARATSSDATERSDIQSLTRT